MPVGYLARSVRFGVKTNFIISSISIVFEKRFKQCQVCYYISCLPSSVTTIQSSRVFAGKEGGKAKPLKVRLMHHCRSYIELIDVNHTENQYDCTQKPKSTKVLDDDDKEFLKKKRVGCVFHSCYAPNSVTIYV